MHGRHPASRDTVRWNARSGENSPAKIRAFTDLAGYTLPALIEYAYTGDDTVAVRALILLPVLDVQSIYALMVFLQEGQRVATGGDEVSKVEGDADVGRWLQTSSAILASGLACHGRY